MEPAVKTICSFVSFDYSANIYFTIVKKTGSFASCVETIVVAPREPTVEPPRNPCPYNNVMKTDSNDSEDWRSL